MRKLFFSCMTIGLIFGITNITLADSMYTGLCPLDNTARWTNAKNYDHAQDLLNFQCMAVNFDVCVKKDWHDAKYMKNNC